MLTLTLGQILVGILASVAFGGVWTFIAVDLQLDVREQLRAAERDIEHLQRELDAKDVLLERERAARVERLAS